MGGSGDASRLSPNWAEVVRLYAEMMDEVMPYLLPAEQIAYQRLFRLSYVQGMDFATCRYEDLAEQCGLSLRTLQRALKGLRDKKLVKTVWYSHGTTTFHVQLLSTLPHRPAFLPRRSRREAPYPSAAPRPSRPPVYEAFSSEDRDLFLTYKRSLSPTRLVELREEALEWLLEKSDGDLKDIDIRDKMDELVLREGFGVERQQRYQHLFDSFY